MPSTIASFLTMISVASMSWKDAIPALNLWAQGFISAILDRFVTVDERLNQLRGDLTVAQKLVTDTAEANAALHAAVVDLNGKIEAMGAAGTTAAPASNRRRPSRASPRLWASSTRRDY